AWTSHIHPDDRAAAEAAETRAKVERKEFLSEYRIIRSDGTIRWILARGRFFYDAGEPVRMVGLRQDITEARQQVEIQRVLVAELQHRTRNLMTVVQSIADQTLDRHIRSRTSRAASIGVSQRYRACRACCRARTTIRSRSASYLSWNLRGSGWIR